MALSVGALRATLVAWDLPSSSRLVFVGGDLEDGMANDGLHSGVVMLSEAAFPSRVEDCGISDAMIRLKKAMRAKTHTFKTFILTMYL